MAQSSAGDEGVVGGGRLPGNVWAPGAASHGIQFRDAERTLLLVLVLVRRPSSSTRVPSTRNVLVWDSAGRFASSVHHREVVESRTRDEDEDR